MTIDLTPDQPRRRKPVSRWLMQQRWRWSRALTLGAQVCVFDADGRVLLIRHGYRPGWHFPGGGVEKGESVLQAAIRELDEEAGITPRAELVLHGIFNNAAGFPGDHIVLYVLRESDRLRVPKPGFEIAEQRFFAPSSLPDGTTAGTRRRLAEIIDGCAIRPFW